MQVSVIEGKIFRLDDADAHRAGVIDDRVDGHDLRADLAEGRQGAEPQVGIVEQAPALGGLSGRGGVLLVGVDLRKHRIADADAYQQQQDTQYAVRHDNPADQTVEHGALRRGIECAGFDLREEFAVSGLEDQGGKNQRRDDAGGLVADAHDAHALRGAVDRADDRNIGIGCRLQDCQTRTDREETEQEDLELTRKGRRDEDEGSDCRKHEAVHDAPLEAYALEQDARRNRHDEIGNVEGEGDEIGIQNASVRSRS